MLHSLSLCSVLDFCDSNLHEICYQISVMPFDWRSELSLPATTPSKVAPSPMALTSAATVSPQPQSRSFAQALVASHSNVTNVIMPQPTIRGDTLSIRITQPVYEKGVNVCKRNLRGRLVLNKGDKPYALKEIEDKLKKQWKTAAPWTLLSLGRGY